MSNPTSVFVTSADHRRVRTARTAGLSVTVSKVVLVSEQTVKSKGNKNQLKY